MYMAPLYMCKCQTQMGVDGTLILFRLVSVLQDHHQGISI